MTVQIKVFVVRGSQLEKDVNTFCEELDKDPDRHFKDVIFQAPDTCVIVYKVEPHHELHFASTGDARSRLARA